MQLQTYVRCLVEKAKDREKYLLLCVLRAKYIRVRYDYLLWNPVNDVGFVKCGITSMETIVLLSDEIWITI